MANSTLHSKVREATSEFEVIQVFDDQQAAVVASVPNVSGEVNVEHAKSLTLYTKGNSSSVAGGSVVLEGSPISAHPGTWKTLGTVTVAAGTALSAVSVTDGDDGFPCRYVRARIATQISNGNIDAYLVVQK